MITMMSRNEVPRMTMVVPMYEDDSVLRSHPDDLATEDVDRRQKGFKRKRSPTMSFPITLHDLLEGAESQGYSNTISWLPDGLRFKIHDPAKFRDEIMRKYFRQTKLESFTRQLYIYGFSKDSGFKKEDMVFFHQLFQRGNVDACKQIGRNQSGDRRVKRKDSDSKQPSTDQSSLDGSTAGLSGGGNLDGGLPWLQGSDAILQNAVNLSSDTVIQGHTFLSRSIQPLAVTNIDLEPRPIEEMLQDYRVHKRQST